MKSDELFKLLKCVAEATAEKLPEIIEPLPVYGKVLSKALEAFRQGIEDFKEQKISADELNQLTATFNDAAKEVASQAETPVYMDCVIFRCKSGCTLSDDQKSMLSSVFKDELEDESVVISDFILDYIGGDANEDDDYSIGDDYVGFNFMMYEDHPYNEEVLSQLKKAINELIGCDALDYFVVSGHDEKYFE